MATKKKSKKMESKLVSYKEDNKREARYISTTYKIPMKTVEDVMKKLGKNGKWCRSRKEIYKELRAMGFVIPIKTKKK